MLWQVKRFRRRALGFLRMTDDENLTPSRAWETAGRRVLSIEAGGSDWNSRVAALPPFVAPAGSSVATATCRTLDSSVTHWAPGSPVLTTTG